MKLEFSGQVF